MKTIRNILGTGILSYGLFWTWNLIFIAFVVLGFSPLVLVETLDATMAGVIPPLFIALGIAQVLIPILASVLGISVLRRSPGKLFMLAYGVEWPLMFILALRFFVLRDATPGLTIVFSIAVIGMVTLLWQILDSKLDTRPTPFLIARAVGLTLVLIVYLYSAVWLAFYAVPVGVGMVRAVLELAGNVLQYWQTISWMQVLYFFAYMSISGVVGGSLLVFTASLFVVTPIALPILAIRGWIAGMRPLLGRVRLPRTAALVTAVAIVTGAIVLWSNQQTQGTAYALLKNPPRTPTEAAQLVQQEETLRAGLVNSYLARYRYISAVGEVQHISQLYQNAVGLTPAQGATVESVYDVIARPLLYEPVDPTLPEGPTNVSTRTDGRAFREEPLQAAKLYKAYFDERIVDGEHPAIANALRSTWQGTQAEAALRDSEDRKVHLDRQDIAVTEHGDWAEIEVHEVYQNYTANRQEVVYYFSLPESAVITGVWLGNSDDRSQRFDYHVAPRGAAQATYQQQVRRNVDPALVEQIGPRQYRLRVFPVEARLWGRSTFRPPSQPPVETPRMHMWLTYAVLARDNAFPLPLLAEKRNVFWDAATVRSVNGKPAIISGDRWIAEAVPASAPAPATAHRVTLATGEIMVAQPVVAGDLPKLPANLRLAVVLDRSRSMRLVRSEAQATLARLATLADADVYLTASAYRGEPPTRAKLRSLDLGQIEYKGGQNAGELLAQYDALRGGDAYDAIVVLTDGSGYELGASPVNVPVPNAPTWMIHLGNQLPLGYDDATLEAIQASGGSVVGSVAEAESRIAFTLGRQATGAGSSDWVDGYTWTVTRGAPSGPAVTGDTPFAPLAARRVILDGMYQERTNLKKLSTLDQLHAVATKNSIVTPFSSMIVLVNKQQEQMLAELSHQGDRFDREVEGVGDTQDPNNLQVTAVPEPHEWLLMGVALILLAGYARRRRWAAALR